MTSPRFTIDVALPADRLTPGMLYLRRDDTLAFECECLGKADNAKARAEGNPERSPLKPYGDTPSGTYKPGSIRVNPPGDRLGRYFLHMEGESGEAARAMAGGRWGIGIHAGRGNDRLVPTYGCIRVRDDDMQRIVDIIGDAPVAVEVRDTYAKPKPIAKSRTLGGAAAAAGGTATAAAPIVSGVAADPEIKSALFGSGNTWLIVAGLAIVAVSVGIIVYSRISDRVKKDH